MSNFNWAHSKECIKDLQRCLRREDPQTRLITLSLGKWKFIGQQLLPLLLINGEDDRELTATISIHLFSWFITNLLMLIPPSLSLSLSSLSHTTHHTTPNNKLVKLLVMLTMPLHPSALPQVKYEHLPYFQDTKEAFLQQHVITTIMQFLVEPMRNRQDPNNNNMIELVLNLFRNLLLIPDVGQATTASGADHRSQMQNRLTLLFQSVCLSFLLSVFPLLQLINVLCVNAGKCLKPYSGCYAICWWW